MVVAYSMMKAMRKVRRRKHSYWKSNIKWAFPYLDICEHAAVCTAAVSARKHILHWVGETVDGGYTLHPEAESDMDR